MSDDSNGEPEVSIPSGKRAQLEYSIRNNIEAFARTNRPVVGLLVNLGLAAVGVVVYWYATGIVAYAGAAWTALNLFGIIKWVFNL